MNIAIPSHPIRERLLAPLNFAAYITWAAVAIEVSGRPFAAPAGFTCMGLFLAGFVWSAFGRAERGAGARCAAPHRAFC